MASCDKCGKNEGKEYNFMASQRYLDNDGHMIYYDVEEDSAVLCEECINSSHQSQMMIRLVISLVFIVAGVGLALMAIYGFAAIAVVIGLGMFYSYLSVKNQDLDAAGGVAVTNFKRSEYPDHATLWSMEDYQSELESNFSTLYDTEENKIIPE